MKDLPTRIILINENIVISLMSPIGMLSVTDFYFHIFTLKKVIVILSLLLSLTLFLRFFDIR